METGSPRPYDLVPTVLLLPEDTEETALTLNGRKRRLTRDDFMRFSTSLKLTGKQATNVYDRFSKGLPAALQMTTRGLCDADMKGRFHALIQDRAARLGL